MRLLHRITVVTLAFLAAVAMILVGGTAKADTYWDTVANSMGGAVGDTHVWQDSNVHILTSGQIDELKRQINASGKPIYIAVVDQGKVGSSTADFPRKLHDSLKQSGVMVVVHTKTFRAAGFDTSREVADKAPDIATAVVKDAKARGAKGPDFEAVSNFVTEANKLDYTTQVQEPVAAPEQPSTGNTSSESSGFPWGWVWFFVGLVFIVFIAAWLVYRSAKRRDEEYYNSYTQPQSAPVTFNPTMPRERDGVVHGVYGNGATDSTADSADMFNLPHDDPDTDTTSYSEPATRHHKKSGKNGYRHHYSTRQTTVNNHYYDGGGGYPAGYYSDSFWRDYLLITALSNNGSYDQGHHDGEHHKSDDNRDSGGTGHDDADDSDKNTSYSTYSSGSSGGGDWNDSDSADDDSSSNSSSSYTPSFSSPSYDFGGGSSSSSDSSGGGGSFDSGSSGGGDF